MEQVAGHTRLGFSKINAGTTVVADGDDCQQLFFMINGTLRIETMSDDRGYTVVEQLEAPVILQPEVIFGYTQRYTHTYIAQTDANFIAIGKDEVLRLSRGFPRVPPEPSKSVLLLRRRKLSVCFGSMCPIPLENRIVRFFAQRCLILLVLKCFIFAMNHLANMTAQ